jgi:hypothetical protein
MGCGIVKAGYEGVMGKQKRSAGPGERAPGKFVALLFLSYSHRFCCATTLKPRETGAMVLERCRTETNVLVEATWSR